MFGRRMLWTTLIGAAVALTARMINRRQSPMQRMFRRIGRGNRWQEWSRPLMQMGRRLAK